MTCIAAPQENIIYGFGSARHGQIGDSEIGSDRMRSCNLPRVIHGFENHKIVYLCANGDQSAALSGNFVHLNASFLYANLEGSVTIYFATQLMGSCIHGEGVLVGAQAVILHVSFLHL